MPAMGEQAATVTVPMTEAELQTSVVELARLTGWRCLHVRRSIGKGRRWQTTTSIVGWPDLFLWRPERRIAAELKSDDGRVTSDQQDVLDSLEAAGIETYVWRPGSMDDIARTLNRRADHRRES
jgi:hypothetical protein